MSEQSGTPSRYARTTQGLLASMVVTLVVVVGIFLVLRLDNGSVEQKPAKVAYLEAVDAARDGGIQVIYPPVLAKGWLATSVAYEPGPRPSWTIGTLTSTGTFAGIVQEDDDLDDLLTTYVDEEPQRGDDVALDSPLAPTWSTWSDSGGDHAFAAQVMVGDKTETLLVYGSASVADLRLLAESLVLS